MTVHIEKSAEDPYLSVVIPTLPDNDWSTVVSRLRNQTATESDYEVIVVSDASKDICEARNTGVEEAKGEIISLTDDDCKPFPHWVNSVTTEFETNETLSVLEGPVVGGINYDKRGMYIGCNLSFRKEAWKSVGGFDSEFAGWRDDTEFGWRVEKYGEGSFSYEVVMYHPPDPRAEWDNNIEDKLEQKYPQLYEERIKPDAVHSRINFWLWRKNFWHFIKQLD